MVSGIYELTCVVNNKAYIGKTKGKIEARVNRILMGKPLEAEQFTLL